MIPSFSLVWQQISFKQFIRKLSSNALSKAEWLLKESAEMAVLIRLLVHPRRLVPCVFLITGKYLDIKCCRNCGPCMANSLLPEPSGKPQHPDVCMKSHFSQSDVYTRLFVCIFSRLLNSNPNLVQWSLLL